MKHSDEFSNSFPIMNAVKQGCVLAPTLFTIFFSMMLREAKEDLHEGVYTQLLTNGSVFNLCRLVACAKTLEELILNLLFADDCALLARTESALQVVVNCFAQPANAFRLAISIKKTEVLFQKPRTKHTPHLTLTSRDTSLMQWNTSHTWKHHLQRRNHSQGCQQQHRKTSIFFRCLQKRVWGNHSLRLTTKIQIYRAAFITTLLYRAQTRVPCRKQVKLHQRCLRSIMGIQWPDYVTNEEVLERTNTTSIESMLMRRQL